MPGLPRTIPRGRGQPVLRWLTASVILAVASVILFIAPLIPTLLASLGATTESIVIFLIIDAFLVVAAIIAQFGTATQRKR